MAGREKRLWEKRNKRPKENAESGKRMSILLLFWEMTELPLVNRWKGIRKFWWGKTGPDADTGITGKDPLRRKTAKNAAESLFPYLRVTFLYCSIQSLKRGFCPVYGEAEGIMTYPYQKRQQKSALPALTGRFSVEQRGSWKLSHIAGFGIGFAVCGKGKHNLVVYIQVVIFTQI